MIINRLIGLFVLVFGFMAACNDRLSMTILCSVIVLCCFLLELAVYVTSLEYETTSITEEKIIEDSYTPNNN